MTQDDVADRMGVTRSAVGKLERGERELGVGQIQSLSKIFRCHPIELLSLVSAEEREALALVRSADEATRQRMIHLLKSLLEPLPEPRKKVA